MTKKITYLILAFAVFTNGCKKNKLPEPAIDAPVFYAKCEADAQNLNMEAGNEDYYMNASHYADTANRMFVFKGDLRKTTCSNCAYAISILLNDFKFSAPAWKMNIDSALWLGQHYYNDQSVKTDFYKVDFIPLAGSAGSFTWTFTDGKTTNSVESYSLSRLLDANKTYSVTLLHDDAMGGCTTSHLNEFKVGKAFQATVTAVREAPSFVVNYKFSAKASGNEPYSYMWDFDDATTKSTEASPTHSFATKNGSYRVKLTLVDSKKDTCISYYQVHGSPENTCAANYVASFKPIDNPKIFSSVTILLTDPNGQVYSSKDYIQEADSWFNIVSVKDYSLKNKSGESTKSVKANFKCKVKNGNKIIDLTNGETVFAVSYK